MQIYGSSSVHGAQHIKAPHSQPTGKPEAASGKSHSLGGDKLEISEVAQLAAGLEEIPEVRTERINEIKMAIANGTYETDEKLSVALDRLLDEIG